MTLPIRQDLVGLAPYGAPQLDVPVCLNVNENPYAPSAAVVATIADEVAKAAAGLNRYPDREFTELRQALAGYLASESSADFLQAENIWAANGSNEVMLQLHQAFGGPEHTVISCAPTYAMYSEYARNTLTNYVEIARQVDFGIDLPATLEAIKQHQPSMVILASPNNPTGTALELNLVEQILAATQVVPGGCLVVIDEAYGEFRRHGVPSALSLLPKHPNLVVTRTMSKAFALAGGRLGYMAASTEIIDAIRIVRLPYHLSAVTQAMALAALKHAPELLSQVEELRQRRDETVDWLRSLGLEVADSDANFAYFGTFPDRDSVFQQLLDRGVLIRATGPAGWLRVSIGTADEMAAFRAALQEVLKNE